jgi:hypothetical protein
MDSKTAISFLTRATAGVVDLEMKENSYTSEYKITGHADTCSNESVKLGVPELVELDLLSREAILLNGTQNYS